MSHHVNSQLLVFQREYINVLKHNTCELELKKREVDYIFDILINFN